MQDLARLHVEKYDMYWGKHQLPWRVLPYHGGKRLRSGIQIEAGCLAKAVGGEEKGRAAT